MKPALLALVLLGASVASTHATANEEELCRRVADVEHPCTQQKMERSRLRSLYRSLGKAIARAEAASALYEKLVQVDAKEVVDFEVHNAEMVSAFFAYKEDVEVAVEIDERITEVKGELARIRRELDALLSD